VTLNVELILNSLRSIAQKRAPCSEDKPCFNDECRILLREYKKNLATFNFSRTSENHEKLITSKRKYKTKQNRLKMQYQRHEGNQLELLRISNPKNFYRIFNGPKKKADKTLITSDFYDHFKNIASYNQLDHDIDLPNLPELPGYQELDLSITIDEIRYAISNSKVDKSPGFDDVINEFFKNFSTLFSPFLEKLFNSILNSGSYPTSWAQGIIVPIYKKGVKSFIKIIYFYLE
jgi:hypothetical protein